MLEECLSLSNQTRIICFNYVRNSILREIFGSMRDEVTGSWRKVHNYEISDL
jgi:hypothetical protein